VFWEASSPKRFAAVILVGSLLAGCAGRPAGVLTPVDASVPNAARVDLLVATTRAPSRDQGILFTGERENRISLTGIAVSIPLAGRRQAGQVQWPATLPPNPETDFATLKVTPLGGVRQAQAWMKQNLTHSRRVLVYVHGFNNHFDDAVYRMAQTMIPARTLPRSCSRGHRVGAFSNMATTGRAPISRAMRLKRHSGASRVIQASERSPSWPIPWVRGSSWNRCVKWRFVTAA
jgi:hypothetical protein